MSWRAEVRTNLGTLFDLGTWPSLDVGQAACVIYARQTLQWVEEHPGLWMTTGGTFWCRVQEVQDEPHEP